MPYGGVSDPMEAKYVIRSIEKNCEVDYDIILGVNEKQDWFTGEQLVVERGPSVDYETYFDTLKKLLAFSQLHKEDFIYIYDDTALIKPLIDVWIFHNLALDCADKYALKEMKGSKHGNTIIKAFELLPKQKRWLFETHCPRMYNGELVCDLFEKFDILNQYPPPAFSTLYYNYFFEAPTKIIAKDNYIRCSLCMEDTDKTGSYLASSESEIIRYSSDKIILHWNPKMFNLHIGSKYILRDYLSKLFSEPSKFEK